MELGIVKPIFHFESILTHHFSLKTQTSHKKLPPLDLSPQESLIFNCLHKTKQCSLDYLSNLTNTTPSSILGSISLLEIKNLIIQTSPGIYSLS